MDIPLEILTEQWWNSFLDIICNSAKVGNDEAW